MTAAALGLAMALHAPAQACSRTIQVGISPLGHAMYLQGGEMRGIVPELMRMLEARSGCRLQLQLRPRARVLLEFSSGELDAITSAQQNTERDRLGSYTPYAYSELDLLLSSTVRGKVESLADFMAQQKITLGLVRGIFLGGTLEASVARLQAQGRIELAPDFENLALRLKAGRIQAAIVPSTIHVKQMADGELGSSIRVIDMPEAEPFPVGLYLHHNVPAADRELLQRHLRALVSEGAVESVYAQFIGPRLARRLFSSPPPARH